ncbi:MAG: hypothetical protein DCF31_09535 [Alphaproteobacteria bacterium]|nr:MAG: hypothetical protein DCF31_09535 [Alphaproteobacteria bacterium]
MRITSTLLIAAIAATLPALPAEARSKTRYEYNGRTYNSYQQCAAAKKKHKRDGALAGAAIAGVGAALLGGNLGESALIAGGGAVVGHEIGAKKRC